MPNAIKRLEDKLKISRNYAKLRSQEVYKALSHEKEKPKLTWPPLPPTSFHIDFHEYLLNLHKWQEDSMANFSEEYPQLFMHGAQNNRGTCLTFQLLEPEVVQLVSMYEAVFTGIFYTYCDFQLDEDNMDECKWNDGHMSFDQFFRFCSDFELFPFMASHHVINQIYQTAESSYPLFVPAVFGWTSKELKKTETQFEVRKCRLEWMNKDPEDLTKAQRSCLKMLSKVTKFADARLLRTRDLFAAVDSKGTGFIAMFFLTLR